MGILKNTTLFILYNYIMDLAAKSRHDIYSTSVAKVQTGVFANLPNKIVKFTGNFENVDEPKNQGVFCQH